MYRIRKLFKFEMAHLLTSSYSKECQTIHGHSYKLEVIIDSPNLNEDGMVIDFKRLKEVLNAEVIEEFDHALVMQVTPEEKKYLMECSKSKLPINSKIVYTDYNPTAENMARNIYDRVYQSISHYVEFIRELKIRIHETDTGYAEYSGGGF